MRARLSVCVLLLVSACQLHAAGLPAPGLTMSAVEQQFGAPLKKNAAVGQPPITRWEYAGFVVIFERSTVVQSVAVSSPGRAAPVPASPAVPSKVQPASPVATPANTPAPSATPTPAEAAEAARQASEREAMTRAAAEANAAKATEAMPAMPASAPATQPAAEPENTKSGGNYSFDPATGRIILN